MLAALSVAACGGGDSPLGASVEAFQATAPLGVDCLGATLDNTVRFRLTFSDPVGDFDRGKVNLVSNNGTACNFTPVSGAVYSVDVVRDGNNDNTITVRVAAGSVHDGAGKAMADAATGSYAVNSALVWQDEFNASSAPDPARWVYDLGTGAHFDGWGNGELQCYTQSANNSAVAGGALHIFSLAERPSGLPADCTTTAYTSARLRTDGKLNFRYGFVEVKAQLPCAQGAWPAIWMLNNAGAWPVSGEIDIAEWFGATPAINTVGEAVHYGTANTTHTGNSTISVCDLAFHRYQLNWTPSLIEIGVDDHKVLTHVNTGPAVWPFDQPFYLLLNLAVGGTGGGSTIQGLPYEMKVDYVRVYKYNPIAGGWLP